MGDDGISAREFTDDTGTDDWRVIDPGAAALFRTESFTAGVELIEAIAELAEAANHHPDVDLRYATVTVRLVSHDIEGLSRRDLALARQISEAARELDIRADPAGLSGADADA